MENKVEVIRIGKESRDYDEVSFKEGYAEGFAMGYNAGHKDAYKQQNGQYERED